MTATPARELALVALLCRTSDRTPLGSRGAQALAQALGERLDLAPRLIGEAGHAREAPFAEDLRDARGCLLEAGGQLDDAFEAGHVPVLLASDCSITVTTLPVLARHRPGARVLWLDAHADFNTPETTPSAFLGGMCLAGACGLWDTGLGDGLDAARVVMCGVRDVDPGERVLLDTKGVGLIEQPSQLAGLLAGAEVFVHLDLDVLDPSELPGAAFPSPGGFTVDGLERLLAEVAAGADIVGVEVTSFTAPELAGRFAQLVAAVLA